MGKIVIIEGIDRIGKSTLTKELVKQGFVPIYDTVRLSETSAKDINEAKITSVLNCLKAYKDSNIDIVFDRFHVSELVYGKLNRGYDCKDFIEWVDSELDQIGALKICITPSNISSLIKCSEEHGSDLTMHNVMYTAFCKHRNWNMVYEKDAWLIPLQFNEKSEV